MDLATLEAEYAAHVAGETVQPVPTTDAAPVAAVRPWNEGGSAAAMAHVDLRSLFPTVSSPTRKSLGLSVSAPMDDESMSVGVSSPVLGLSLSEIAEQQKFSLTTSMMETNFVEWVTAHTHDP